ncbi:MAG: NAD(P)/FAD-dependent oxidoreductase [Promethearchaeota archaeon]|nr:MAG: NAD(P)/FAD-dependent oxidoreductase [Candidatus Lokiarchaeota archaeon]
MKIIVIGSGLSGLTAAASLCQEGHDVSVYEQYNRPGGVTAPYEKNGYKWDLGQLIIEGLGPDEPLGKILTELNIKGIEIKLEDRGYVFPNFEINKPKEYEGIRWRIEYLKKLFPEDSEGLDKYWKDFLHFTSLMTYGRRMEYSSGLKSLYWKLRLFAKLLGSGLYSKKDWSATELMNYYFTNENLQLVFISIIADFFTPPSKFLGLGVFSLNPEAIYDKRIPKKIDKNTIQLFHYDILGGISNLVDNFVSRIEELGGKLLLNNPVKKILLQDNQVKGAVDGKGNKVEADVVIASGAAKETFFNLIGKENLPNEFIQSVNDLMLMESVFMLQLGIEKSYELSKYNKGYTVRYYYGINSTKELEEEIEYERNGRYHKGEKGFVVHIPTFHTPEMAPNGNHAMTIYTICPDQLKEGSWEVRKEEFAAKLIGYAEKYYPNLSDAIILKEILTPKDFRERTYSDHHAFGGIAPYINTTGISHKTPIKGLWFIGAQSETGGGVNNVMPGAYKVAKLINDELS